MDGIREESKAEAESEAPQEYELSEKAKIGPDEEKHIKELEDGRMVVSREPKFGEGEEDIPEEAEKTQEKESLEESKTPKPEESTPRKTEETKPATPEENKSRKPEDSTKEMEDREKRETGSAESQTETIEQTNEKVDLDTSKLVNLLASYGVPLDSSVRELLQEINRKGERHLQRELSKRLGGD